MIPTETSTSPLVLRLRGAEDGGIRRRREPVTVGVPVPRGALSDATRLSLLGPGDRPIPVQAGILDRWPDGSARWALLDFLIDLAPRAETELALELDGSSEPVLPAAAISVRETSKALVVDTGAAQFALDRAAFLPFRTVRVAGRDAVDPQRSGCTLRDERGDAWSAAVHAIAVEAHGPIRATARVEGAFERPGERPLLEFVARLHFHTGSGAVRVVFTVRNPRRAAHPSGVWELGDAGSVLVRDLSVRVASAGGRDVSWSPELGTPLEPVRGGRLSLYQDSSGGKNWRSRVHLDRDGTIPMTFRGWRARAGGEERSGLRATPRVAVAGDAPAVGASMRHFWQNFPKAVDASDGVLSIGLLPPQSARAHEIQGGEQKTHELWLTFGPEAVAPETDAQRSPLLVRPEPEWFEASAAIPYLTARESDANAPYLALVDQAIDGEHALERKREVADEYGWRNFGETWADHESKYWDGESTFVSHYNNQYDVVYGAVLQFARSGDARWWRILTELARHVIDIDVYHTEEDKAAYNGGLFWHTVHYLDGGRSTHRSYPRGSVGGGPDNEHNYTTGLMHYWFLTGDPLGRDAAIAGARWVVAADDGARTPLRCLSKAPTGLATKTRDFEYHGPGRGSGNSIAALLDGWRLTGDVRLLEKCDEIVRRTIHPDDDPGRLGLLDAELRWSYTVHLQALGKYLDAMAEAGRLDGGYAYARVSLLRYARWMLEHERPILDRPEKLEYPNETWAAQDLRKSEVFAFAALHAEGPERERFLDRGEWFFRTSLETLGAFDTRGYLRPVVLLMRYGLMQSWFDRHPDEARPRPEGTHRFAPPSVFVPQKILVRRKLERVALAASGAALLTTSAVIASLLR